MTTSGHHRHHWTKNSRTIYEQSLCLTGDGGVYVITLARKLNDLWYRLKVIATDSGSLTTSTFLDIFVNDDDDDDDDDHSNALRLTRSIYRAILSIDTLPGQYIGLAKY